jgi:hypothetical protein
MKRHRFGFTFCRECLGWYDAREWSLYEHRRDEPHRQARVNVLLDWLGEREAAATQERKS